MTRGQPAPAAACCARAARHERLARAARDVRAGHRAVFGRGHLPGLGSPCRMAREHPGLGRRPDHSAVRGGRPPMARSPRAPRRGQHGGSDMEGNPCRGRRPGSARSRSMPGPRPGQEARCPPVVARATVPARTRQPQRSRLRANPTIGPSHEVPGGVTRDRTGAGPEGRVGRPGRAPGSRGRAVAERPWTRGRDAADCRVAVRVPAVSCGRTRSGRSRRSRSCPSTALRTGPGGSPRGGTSSC